MKTSLPVALLFALFVPLRVAAQVAPPSQILAVLEFQTRLEGTERKAVDAAYLADSVRAAVLENVPSARVMTRENIMVLLQASGKKLEDCQGECEVETGRRLGADLVISGDLLKFGSSFKLSLKLHRTSDGSLLSGATSSGTTIDQLDEETGKAVKKLLRPLMGEPAPRPIAEPAPARPPPARVESEQKAPPQTPAIPQRPQPVAPSPSPTSGAFAKFIIETTGSKSYNVIVRAGARTFDCGAPVTQTSPCTLVGVPEGHAVVNLTGDARLTHEVRVGRDTLRVTIEPRGKWMYIVGGATAGTGLLLLATSGGSTLDSTTSAEYKVYGGLLGLTGAVFLLIALARAPVSVDESNEAVSALPAESGVRFAGLGVAPVPGGLAAAAAFRF